MKTISKNYCRQEALAIVDNIISSYEKSSPTLTWLDQTTRGGVIKKLKAIVKVIGYSTENPEDVFIKLLDDFYKGYDVANKDYFGNQVRFMRRMTAKAFVALPLLVHRDEFDISLTTVNGFQNPSSNLIYCISPLVSCRRLSFTLRTRSMSTMEAWAPLVATRSR